MRSSTSTPAAIVGLVLLAYPFALGPASPAVRLLAAVGAASLGATLLARRAGLVALTGALAGGEYAVALVTGDAALDAFVSLFATGLLVLLELLYMSCDRGGDIVDPGGTRRRLVYVVLISGLGCLLAVVAQVAGTLGYSSRWWMVLVATASGIVAVTLISTLALRALND